MTKNPAAVSLGRLGGKARASKLSAERRSQIAAMGGKKGKGKRKKQIITMENGSTIQFSNLDGEPFIGIPLKP